MAIGGKVGRRVLVCAGVSALGLVRPKWFPETGGACSVVPRTIEERVSCHSQIGV